MKQLTSTSRNLYIAAAALAVFAFPIAAQARVSITEVMYDAPGSDQGHEWVEVANDASGPVDLTNWRFMVAGNNHLLVAEQGTTSLAANQVAIISNDPQSFLADYPAYAGTLFKSSFSLTNTGSTLSLKDAKSNIVDSVTYTSSEGAAGDGNSLHVISSGTLTPGAPNPGSLSATKAIVPPPKVVAVPVVKSSTKTAKSTSSKSSNAYASGNQSPALPLSLPSLPTISSAWAYGLGLIALLILGAAAALYARLDASARATNLPAGEFELE